MIIQKLKQPVNDNRPNLDDVMFNSYVNILKYMDDMALEWPLMPHDEFNNKFQALMLKHLIAVWPEKYYGS